MNVPHADSTETGLCCSPILDTALDETSATELAALLKALADPVRLRLISLISAAPGHELCACDLPAMVGKSQPTVSHHLSQLAKAGLVDREQRGKWAWFKVRPERLEQVTDALAPHADVNLQTSPPIGQPS